MVYYLKSEVESNVLSSLPPAGLKARKRGKRNFEKSSLIISSLAGQMFSFKKHFEDLQVIIGASCFDLTVSSF